MQAIPDSRSQSFEELYGPPENFLEIEVRSPCRLSPAPANTQHGGRGFKSITSPHSTNPSPPKGP